MAKIISTGQSSSERRVRARARKLSKRNGQHPVYPEPTPNLKFAPHEISKKTKSLIAKHTQEIESKKDIAKVQKTLENIKDDVTFLLPQLLKEIETYDYKGGLFAGIKTERRIWQRFLHSYARFKGNLSKACDFTGISRMHFYRARDRYPSLRTLCEIIDDRYIDQVEELTKTHALIPSSVLERMFLLKAYRPHRYADKEEKKDVEVKISFNNYKDMRYDRTTEEGRKALDGVEKLSHADSGRLQTPTPTVSISQE